MEHITIETTDNVRETFLKMLQVSDTIIKYGKDVKNWVKNGLKEHEKNKKKSKKKKNKNSAIHKKKKVSPKLLKFMNKYKTKDYKNSESEVKSFPEKPSEDWVLCENQSKYDLVSRTDALRNVSNYIKNVARLQIPEDKKYFKPDDVLIELLGLDIKEKYTFLNLNKYLTPLLKI